MTIVDITVENPDCECPILPLPPEPVVTTFQEMYDFFLAGITDDMFLELTKEDTLELLEEILIAAIPHFEFPKWEDPFDLDLRNKRFSAKLTLEEMIIIRYYMIAEWFSLQLATVDLAKQMYSGSDFKFTSQASHMKQLSSLKKDYEQRGFHQQRLYCRRHKVKGKTRSTFLQIMQPYKE